MIFLSNIIRIKRISIIALFIALVFLGYEYFHSYRPNIWGDEPDEPYITISGKKPIDADVTAYGTFFGGGETCKSFSWSASDGKKRKGGKADILFDHNFSESNDSYELRLPFHNFISSGCDMKLHQIEVEAKNDFDQVGFAKLRIYSPTNNYDKVIDMNSIVQAKECNARIWQWASKDRWSGAMTCFYFVNDIIKTNKPESNAYTVYYDFSKFNNDTVIHYDILAGENYRSEPLDKEKGPQ